VVSVLTASRSALAAGPLQQCQARQEGTRVGVFEQGVDSQHPPALPALLWHTSCCAAQPPCPLRWDLPCWEAEGGCSSRVTQGGFRRSWGSGGFGGCIAVGVGGREEMREALGREVSVSRSPPGCVKLGI